MNTIIHVLPDGYPAVPKYVKQDCIVLGFQKVEILQVSNTECCPRCWIDIALSLFSQIEQGKSVLLHSCPILLSMKLTVVVSKLLPKAHGVLFVLHYTGNEWKILRII